MSVDRVSEVNPTAGEGSAAPGQTTNGGFGSAGWNCRWDWDDDPDTQYPFDTTSVVVPVAQVEETGDETGEGDVGETGY